MASDLPHGLRLDQVLRYLENRTKEFGDFAPALAARDAGTIRSIAHRVKGNAALYGVPELGIVAGKLCAATETADWNAIEGAIAALRDRLAAERKRFSA